MHTGGLNKRLEIESSRRAREPRIFDRTQTGHRQSPLNCKSLILLALPRGLRRPSEFNHLAKSGTPNRSTQSLSFLPPVSHQGCVLAAAVCGYPRNGERGLGTATCPPSRARRRRADHCKSSRPTRVAISRPTRRWALGSHL